MYVTLYTSLSPPKKQTEYILAGYTLHISLNQHKPSNTTNWPEVLEAEVDVLNLLEEVTEEGGVATSVSPQEPRSGSASTVRQHKIVKGGNSNITIYNTFYTVLLTTVMLS